MKNYRGFSGLAVLLVISVITLLLITMAVVLKRNDVIKPTPQKNAVKATPPSSGTAPTAETPSQKYSTTDNWEDVKLSDDDYQRSQDIQQMEFKIVSYKIKFQVYPADAAAADTVQQKNPLIDPSTKQPYKIVDTTPSLGEMQYKIATNCDNSNRNFESNSSSNIYAFLVRLSEGSFICKSNIN